MVYGGNGLPFLAQPVFEYLLSGSYNAISVPASEIPDPVIQFIVEKVLSMLSLLERLIYILPLADHWCRK